MTTIDMTADYDKLATALSAAGIDPVSLVGGPGNAQKIMEAVTGYRGGDPGADPAEEWDRQDAVHDAVNHPSHYTGFSNGAEVIDITENLTFNRGNAVKYLARAGKKGLDLGMPAFEAKQLRAKELEDLRKAAWYVAREIQRLEKESTE